MDDETWIGELEERIAKADWQPIETAPRDGSVVVLYAPRGFHLVKGQKVGSGFIIDAKGHAVTTAGVASKASALTVKLADGRRIDARLVATDSLTGLSVIRILADGLPHLNWGNSSHVSAGDEVFVPLR